ncbi:ACP S-malonyltransferase [Streptomyces alkaliterrae]|uniref:Malonyl CoA-acyl carrier protein transacylase n=1 Tax=Streptomyces alkaliterrae TaxID=2213162 RepID=A0A5P0YPN0_9ACTN|nr:ACP S-malonyltransferase [Streptomyces alkaliterrae]MBB1252758.1 ACP S-malonyltransferase [Streptomyces alkaliterrae]MBB1258523.1 ACP S-malonyltransferase [Streptomyces alkaliterrae]MQS00479.1 acyltransferase domain-containing protein [Streptomyces alkaliterrae]
MSAAPIGLVFPGQGTQRESMGEPWRESPAWPLVDQVSEHSSVDVEELLLRTPGERLRRTDLAQLAVYTVSLMAWREAADAGLLTGAVACAGHSLGEYTALTAAGVLDLRDGVALVTARGRAMRQAAEDRPGTMGVLVRAGLPEAEKLVAEAAAEGHGLWVANINGPGQVVVSGGEEAVGFAERRAPDLGAKLIRVPVGGAFHSPFMAPAAEELRAAVVRASFGPGRMPVVANVDGRPYDGSGDWPELVTRQLVSPVRWEESVHTLTGRLGCRRLVELGPGRTLAGLVRRITPDVPVDSYDAPAARP